VFSFILVSFRKRVAEFRFYQNLESKLSELKGNFYAFEALFGHHHLRQLRHPHIPFSSACHLPFHKGVGERDLVPYTFIYPALRITWMHIYALEALICQGGVVVDSGSYSAIARRAWIMEREERRTSRT
jgi:hypothetical protein